MLLQSVRRSPSLRSYRRPLRPRDLNADYQLPLAVVRWQLGSAAVCVVSACLTRPSTDVLCRAGELAKTGASLLPLALSAPEFAIFHSVYLAAFFRVPANFSGRGRQLASRHGEETDVLLLARLQLSRRELYMLQ